MLSLSNVQGRHNLGGMLSRRLKEGTPHIPGTTPRLSDQPGANVSATIDQAVLGTSYRACFSLPCTMVPPYVDGDSSMLDFMLLWFCPGGNELEIELTSPTSP